MRHFLQFVGMCGCLGAGLASAGTPLVVDTCAQDAAYGQPMIETQAATGYSGDGDDLRSYDSFDGLTGPITEIVWWGGGVAGGECVHEPNNFEIAFYENNGGQPGDLLASQEVSPTVTSTGFAGPFGTIYRHEATLATPVNIISGWVSVFAVDFDGCYFYWATGGEGNGNAYMSGFGNVANDFAFCLTTTGAFAETTCTAGATVSQPLAESLFNPGFSDAGDDVRSYDNFSGVDEPIVRVVWWGGGSAAGADCLRGPEFEIAFYESNGGQPGTLITTENVTATMAPTGTASSLGDLYRYEAVLNTPVDLSAGWISVFTIDFVDCYFYWANSVEGNGIAHVSNSNVNADFAFCLFSDDGIHSADPDGDNIVSLSELLRVIQFFNSDGFGCEFGTEDGYAPNDLDQDCLAHDSDYNPEDWAVSLGELLRLIQFFNSDGYNYCPGDATEDAYCPGPG